MTKDDSFPPFLLGFCWVFFPKPGTIGHREEVMFHLRVVGEFGLRLQPRCRNWIPGEDEEVLGIFIWYMGYNRETTKQPLG